MIPLARDLVAPRHDLPNQLGCGVRDPAQHEKRSASATFVEQVQSPPGAGLEPHLEPVPPVLMDDGLEWGYMEVILERNRQHMCPRGTLPRQATRLGSPVPCRRVLGKETGPQRRPGWDHRRADHEGCITRYVTDCSEFRPGPRRMDVTDRQVPGNPTRRFASEGCPADRSSRRARPAALGHDCAARDDPPI